MVPESDVTILREDLGTLLVHSAAGHPHTETNIVVKHRHATLRTHAYSVNPAMQWNLGCQEQGGGANAPQESCYVHHACKCFFDVAPPLQLESRSFEISDLRSSHAPSSMHYSHDHCS